MLHNSQELEGCVIGATDGEIGEVKDFYFDDVAWVIRYLVVATGTWLANRKVLVLPFALARPDWTRKRLPASVTTEQVRNSPHIDTDKPVSRQHQVEFLEYYRYPTSSSGFGAVGIGPNPNLMGAGPGTGWSEEEYGRALSQRGRREADEPPREDPHLRSGCAILGYHIASADGDIGHVQGLLVDDDTWAIRYLVVNTSNWWLGHQILVAPQWIAEVSWLDSKVRINLPRQTLKDAPSYDSNLPPDRQQEGELLDYYSRARALSAADRKEATP